MAAEQIRHPFRLDLAEMLPGIFLAESMGNFQRFFQGNLMESAQFPNAAGGIFQHRVDIGSEFRRIDSGFLPLLHPKAVPEEVGQAALRLPVDLRCRKIQRRTVESGNVFPLHLPEAVIPPIAGFRICIPDVQSPGNVPGVPPGEVRPRFQSIRRGKAQCVFHLLLPARKLTQAAVDKGRLVAGAKHADGRHSAAEAAVNLRKFRLHALHSAAGEGHPQLPEGNALLIGQDTGRAGVTGELAFLRTQHDQVLFLMAAHSGHGADLHRVQHRRDGSHVVLAQQQPEKADKLLPLPVSIPQHVIHLFQGAQKDFPQLVQDLRAPVVPGGVQLLCHAGKPHFQGNIFQKTVQRQHLSPQVGSVPEALPEPRQRRDSQFPRRVQFFQTLPVILRPHAAETVRVVFPALRPLLPANAPDDSVILDPVAGIRVNRRQGRAEIAQDTFLVEAAQGSVQRRQHRGDDAFLQNILGAGLVHGDVEPVKYQIHQRLIHRHIGANHRNVPTAAPGGEKITNSLRRAHAFQVRRFRLEHIQTPLRRAPADYALKNPLPHGGKGQALFGNGFDLHFHPGATGAAKQLGRRIPRLFKGQKVGILPVAVQAHRHVGGRLNEMLQNRQMLPGKVREAVYVKNVLLCKISLLHLFQEPRHLIPRVALAPAAQGVVALHQKRQLLQLLCQTAFCFPGGAAQIFGRNAAALKFIHSIDKAGKKFRLCLHGGIGFQTAGKIFGRSRHGHHPAAVVQAFLRGASHGIRHAPGKPGKGQHLGIPAGRVPGSGAQPPLRFMADEFGNHQNPVSLPPGNVRRDALHDLVPVGRPVRAQQKVQHTPTPFSFLSMIP